MYKSSFLKKSLHPCSSKCPAMQLADFLFQNMFKSNSFKKIGYSIKCRNEQKNTVLHKKHCLILMCKVFISALARYIIYHVHVCIGEEKKIFIIWLFCHPWFSTIDTGAINFRVLIDLLIGIITMHLVFFSPNICVEVERKFGLFSYWPRLGGPGDGKAMNFTIQIPLTIEMLNTKNVNN